MAVHTVRVRKFPSGNWDENSAGSLMRKSELNSVTRVSPRAQQKLPNYGKPAPCALLLRLPDFQVLHIHFRRSLKLLQWMADPSGQEFVLAAAPRARPLFIRSLVEILEIWPIFVGGKFINRVNSKGEERERTRTWTDGQTGGRTRSHGRTTDLSSENP